jgi:hypothetical protein
VPVENLAIGELVMTSNGALPVKWVGRRTIRRNGSASWHPSVMPIRVARFAIDDQTPRRDVYRIMTIDRGRLVEDGTHDELVQKGRALCHPSSRAGGHPRGSDNLRGSAGFSRHTAGEPPAIHLKRQQGAIRISAPGI